ncbi:MULTISPECIES: hypothetical protein [Bacillus amyloliquefaciens group]|uniref:hypothetical protein n=1 Tax=Bacillus amyloliquefaciens group TaxID=1938374 RepID=UPI00226F2A4E|nr:hypothetical protein [Bacillus velezensis]MCY0091449.1 hypothetical protein [Bacillus velezensis]
MTKVKKEENYTVESGTPQMELLWMFFEAMQDWYDAELKLIKNGASTLDENHLARSYVVRMADFKKLVVETIKK